MRAVKVTFEDFGKIYTYACFDDTVVRGDYVIIIDPRGEPKLVKVVEICVDIPKVVTKAILGKINITDFKSQQAKFEQYQRAKQQLEIKLARFHESKIYEVLIQEDPEAAELIKIIKGH